MLCKVYFFTIKTSIFDKNDVQHLIQQNGETDKTFPMKTKANQTDDKLTKDNEMVKKKLII